MKFLPFLLFLTVFCEAYEGECKFPKPMKNFSPRRFSGSWYYAAFDSLVSREAKAYENTTCAISFFHFDKGNIKRQKWDEDYLLRSSVPVQSKGYYYLPDPREGFVKLFYINGNFMYDFTVLCTDYETYMAAYACSQYKPTEKSEFVMLFVRDDSAYDAVISDKKLQQCFRAITNTAVKDITRRPYTNCQNNIMQ